MTARVVAATQVDDPKTRLEVAMEMYGLKEFELLRLAPHHRAYHAMEPSSQTCRELQQNLNTERRVAQIDAVHCADDHF